MEHEISVITALQLIEALDVVKYQPLPVYIAPSGRWYAGEDLLDRKFYRNMPQSLSLVQEVTLLPIPNVGGLTVLSPKRESTFNMVASTEEVIPVDIFFASFHGTYGEDGCVQGLFEMADVAYTGCGVLSSALSMSKIHCKKLLESYNIPVLPSAIVQREQIEAQFGANLPYIRNEILNTPRLDRFPLFVKPNNLGSSIAVAKVDDPSQLDAALLKVFKYDVTALVEPCISNKLEINVSVLQGVETRASVVEIPVSSAGRELTYEDKYLRGGGKKSGELAQGMAGLTRVIDPTDLDPRIKAQAQDYAVRSFQALGCAGVARVDFMLDLNDDQLYFNEINPLPGSLSFYLWNSSKPPLLFTEILTRMIERAEERAYRKSELSRDIAFQALLR